MRALTTLLAAALIAMPVSMLTACAPGASPQASSAHSSADSSNPDVSNVLTLADGWAKAGASGGMTGVFGTLNNASEEDLEITGVESTDAGMIELHEVTADGVMQPISGKVVVPAQGSFELAPGANHIMLMDLTRDLLAGDEVTFTLLLKAGDGSTSSVTFTVLVKDYAGANENYGGAEGAHDDSAGHAAAEDGAGHDADSHGSH